MARARERHLAMCADPDRRELAFASRFDEEITDVRVEMRDRGRLLVGRERHMDSADTEFEVFLDERGRATTARQRAARFGAVAPGAWETVRYRYPTAAQFAWLVGGRPRPRCA